MTGRILGLAAGLGVAAASALGWSTLFRPSHTTIGVSPPTTGATGPVGSETYAWRPVAIGAGGFITGIDSDPTGVTRIIRTDVYGAYRWMEREARWVQLVTSASMPVEDRVQDGANEGVFEIVVAPSMPSRIYMALKGFVYRSDDSGVHFARTASPAPFPLVFDPNSEFRNYGPFMAVDPRDPNLVLFGTPGDGLWRTGDGGGSWERVTSVPVGANLQPSAGVRRPGTIIWFEGAAGGRIWAMSPGRGVFISSDRGRHFAPLSELGQPAPLTLRQGAFASNGSFFGVDSESQQVWHYRAGVWTELTGQNLLPARRFATLAVNPHTGSVYVIDEGARTWRSVDGGESWQRLPHRARVGEGDPPWLRVSNQSYFAMGRVQFDPVVADRLWAGAGIGVFRADLPWDAEQVSWTSQSRGIEELVANDVIQPIGQAPLFGAWDFGVHVKNDLDRFSTTFGPKERLLIAVQQLAWSPANPAFVVTNASDTRIGCCSQDGDAVLAGYSLDGGRSWSKFASLPQPPGTEAGDPWRMSFGSIAVSANDTDNIVWAPSFHRSPFVTRDQGRSWSRIVLPGERLPYTGSHVALHYHRKTLAADRVAPGVFYLVHSGDGDNAALAGLWVTRDGGTQWSRVFRGEIAPSSQYSAKLRVVPGHAGHLFFTSGVDGVVDTRLRRSTDGGASWRSLDGVDHADDVAFGKTAAGASYPTIFLSGRVAGEYGIWRSIDAAESWQRVGRFPVGSLDQVTVMEADPDIFGRVYLGFKGSGWIYGMPARCSPAEYRFADASECVAVR
jgi:photosystem II stability/assembly factor-like uncharacterized protein